MKHLTVRGVPSDLAKALEAEKRRRGESLNQTVIDLLRRAVGLGGEEVDNGLSKYAGAWSQSEFDAFQDEMTPFESVDEEHWS